MEPQSAQAAPTSDKLLFECTIEVDRHSSLKNRKLISRGRIYTDPRVKNRQNFLVLALQERARRVLLDKPIGCALRAVWNLEFAAFWTKTRPIRLNRKSGDLSNSIQGCEDALTKAMIIEDDSLIIEMSARKVPSHRNAITIQLFAK